MWREGDPPYLVLPQTADLNETHPGSFLCIFDVPPTWTPRTVPVPDGRSYKVNN
jgi:hypothetical protein